MTTAKTPAKAPAKAKAKATAVEKPPVQSGAKVAREAAAAANAGKVDVHTTRAFTLHREDGTSHEFGHGLNRNIHPDDADHWFVKAHTVVDPNAPASGVADVRKVANPNGAQAQAAHARRHDADLESTTQALDMGKGEGGTGEGDDEGYSEDDVAADRARAEAGDEAAQARLDEYEAAMRGDTSED